MTFSVSFLKLGLFGRGTDVRGGDTASRLFFHVGDGRPVPAETVPRSCRTCNDRQPSQPCRSTHCRRASTSYFLLRVPAHTPNRILDEPNAIFVLLFFVRAVSSRVSFCAPLEKFSCDWLCRRCVQSMTAYLAGANARAFAAGGSYLERGRRSLLLRRRCL